MPGRKSVQTVGVPKASRKVSGDAEALGSALGPRKGKGGAHGVPSGFYAESANPEAKHQAEEMREYFRHIVRMVLERQGTTQAELARGMGVGLGTIKDKLAGRSSIDIGEATQIAVLLGGELAQFVDRKVTIDELYSLKPPYPTQGCFSPTTLGSVAAYSVQVGNPSGIDVTHTD